MADVTEVRSTIQGQAQADKEAVLQPHDGKVDVRETRVALDKVITDANSEDAVQIPEEAGTVEDRLALPIEALSADLPTFEDEKSSKKK